MTGHHSLSRRALLTAPALFAALPQFARAASQTTATDSPICIVLNSGGATVSIIDMTTRRVLREEPTFREPSHWALTPDRKRLLIADASGNALFFLDPVTGKELGHKLIPDPYQLWFSPDGRYLTVNCLRLNHVDIYHAETLTLAKRLRVGSMPSHLSYTPDSRTVFCSMQDSGTLVAIDLATMTERWRAKVGKTPAGVFWHDGVVLVGIMGSDNVAVVEPASGKLIRRIVTDKGAHNLFLTPNRKHIYVTNRVAGSLSVLDAKSLDVVKRIPMPGGPDDLCFAPDGKLWISLRFSSHVGIYDPTTERIDRISVGRSPHGIFISTLLSDTPARAAMRLA
ncbi:YncE family protein [Acidiphilium multivorum]|uniref:YncE family protein n=1 Tax=Acidiphilium multivorum TaxID=62140 RepID=UPI0039C9AB99